MSIETNSDLGYAPHYYGPYSALMAETLAERTAEGDLVETIKLSSMHFVGHDQIKKFYEYRLTEAGNEAAKTRCSWKKEEFNRAIEIASAIRRLDVDYLQLSFAAKVHCIARRKQSTLDVSEIKKEAGGMGWAMSSDDVLKGIEILRALKLLKD